MREACPWQRTGGVVDHQMVDIAHRDAGLGKGGGAGDVELARGGAIRHLAHRRCLDALTGAEQVDWPCSLPGGSFAGSCGRTRPLSWGGATKTANFHGTIDALIWIFACRVSIGLTNVSLSDGLLVVGGAQFQIPVRRI
jgi:hypothetical protein